MNMITKLSAVSLALTLSSCAVMRGQEDVSAYASDTAITTALKAKYAADRDVAATSIGVETLEGTVQLSGFAKSQTEKDKAASIARATKGVKSVKNDVIVRQ